MATRIGVLGATGKMGCAIVRVIAASQSESAGASTGADGSTGADKSAGTLAAAVERAGHPALGQDAGEVAGAGALGVAIQAALPAAGEADVWIDFSIPAATMAAVRAAVAGNVAMVIGTTGLAENERLELLTAARRIPIVFTPNMSVGVNVLLKLVSDAARALGPSYDLEIVEAHHRAKRDAPSGTALRLGEALADATGRSLAASARYERHGEIGARAGGEIGIQTVRGGDVVGDHTVYFLGTGERIEITHRATSRDTFAQGAVRAALWVVGRAPGLYDMRHVLGL